MFSFFECIVFFITVLKKLKRKLFGIKKFRTTFHAFIGAKSTLQHPSCPAAYKCEFHEAHPKASYKPCRVTIHQSTYRQWSSLVRFHPRNPFSSKIRRCPSLLFLRALPEKIPTPSTLALTLQRERESERASSRATPSLDFSFCDCAASTPLPPSIRSIFFRARSTPSGSFISIVCIERTFFTFRIASSAFLPDRFSSEALLSTRPVATLIVHHPISFMQWQHPPIYVSSCNVKSYLTPWSVCFYFNFECKRWIIRRICRVRNFKILHQLWRSQSQYRAWVFWRKSNLSVAISTDSQACLVWSRKLNEKSN